MSKDRSQSHWSTFINISSSSFTFLLPTPTLSPPPRNNNSKYIPYAYTENTHPHRVRRKRLPLLLANNQVARVGDGEPRLLKEYARNHHHHRSHPHTKEAESPEFKNDHI